jgi:hypothetical protein
MQLKLAHGYFRSYLVRLPNYDDDSCPYYHRSLDLSSQIRQKTISQLDKRDQNLYNLFMTREDQEQLI